MGRIAVIGPFDDYPDTPRPDPDDHTTWPQWLRATAPALVEAPNLWKLFIPLPYMLLLHASNAAQYAACRVSSAGDRWTVRSEDRSGPRSRQCVFHFTADPQQWSLGAIVLTSLNPYRCIHEVRLPTPPPDGLTYEDYLATRVAPTIAERQRLRNARLKERQAAARSRYELQCAMQGNLLRAYYEVLADDPMWTFRDEDFTYWLSAT